MATYALLIAITTLALFSSRASSHPAAKHPGGVIKAPLVHKIANMRWRTNQLLRQKCRPAWPLGIVPAYRIPRAMRPWVVDVWGPRLDRAIIASSRCLPTDPAGIIRWVFPSATESSAIAVASCESGLSPNAQNPSGASGLFQLMPIHWAGKFDPFNPVANTRFAYRLSNAGYDWSAWVCKP